MILNNPDILICPRCKGFGATTFDAYKGRNCPLCDGNAHVIIVDKQSGCYRLESDDEKKKRLAILVKETVR